MDAEEGRARGAGSGGRGWVAPRPRPPAPTAGGPAATVAGEAGHTVCRPTMGPLAGPSPTGGGCWGGGGGARVCVCGWQHRREAYPLLEERGCRLTVGGLLFCLWLSGGGGRCRGVERGVLSPAPPQTLPGDVCQSGTPHKSFSSRKSITLDVNVVGSPSLVATVWLALLSLIRLGEKAGPARGSLTIIWRSAWRRTPRGPQRLSVLVPTRRWDWQRP